MKSYFQKKQSKFLLSTDKSLLNITTIHNYLKEAYWSKNIPLSVVQKSIEGSLCFGIYCKKKQVAFARVITDYATFGYLADVFVLPDYQQQGLGKFLIRSIMEHPDLQGFRGWILATKDAHGLYAQFGFKSQDQPELRMIKTNFKAYS